MSRNYFDDGRISPFHIVMQLHGKIKEPYKYLILVIFIFCAALLAHDWIYFQNFCYHTFDLGIYMEGVRDFKFQHPNPFLFTFGYGFLNNHWNPALALAQVPSFFFGLPAGVFFTETLAHVATALVPVYLAKRKYLEPWTAVLCSSFLLINENILEASLAIPIHCEVWANFILLSMTASICLSYKTAEDVKIPLRTPALSLCKVLLFVFVISFFGEQFTLAGLGLSLAYFTLSERKLQSLVIVFFAALLVWFTVAGREWVLGPILHHTDRVRFSPSAIVKLYGGNLAQLKVILKFLASLVPFGILLWRSKKNFDWRQKRFPKLFLTAGIFGPLVLGRLLSNSFGHQYSALLPVSVAAFFMIFLRDVEISPKFYKASILFFALLSFSKFERVVNVVTGRRFPNCVQSVDVRAMNTERIKNLRDAINFIVEKPYANGAIYASGSLVPNLVSELPTHRTVSVNLDTPIDYTLFDWVILEHGDCGDNWPFSRERIEEFIQKLSKRGDFRIVKETNCLFMAQKLLPHKAQSSD